MFFVGFGNKQNFMEVDNGRQNIAVGILHQAYFMVGEHTEESQKWQTMKGFVNAGKKKNKYFTSSCRFSKQDDKISLFFFLFAQRN